MTKLRIQKGCLSVAWIFCAASRAAEPVPEFTIPDSLPAWEKKRVETRVTLAGLLGKFPPRPAVPEVRAKPPEDRGEYFLERFEIDNGMGEWIPGYCFRPKSAGRHPAILYCHWHAGQYDSGKEEMFGNKYIPYEPGPALARRGYVVLGIDAAGFGERNGKGPDGANAKDAAGEASAAKYQLWMGRSLFGQMVREDQLALDYLAARPEVDPSRIGVTGISMGSTRTWWLMAMDDRPKAACGVACLTRYQELIQEKMLHSHGIYYYVPGMLQHFDTEAVVSLIAPRPMLFLTGDLDLGSPAAGIRRIGEVAEQAFRLHGETAAGNYRSVIYPQVGHDYTPEMWREMNAWMDRHLKGD